MDNIIQLLRKLIKEEIGRNYHTLDNDPYSWEDYPGMEIDIYPADNGNEYHVKITVDGNKELSTPLRVFSNEEEARSFARNHADVARRKLLNQEQ
ncbi:MAG: hypothetical protein CME70_18785 [Halobacteriovorax sp.]|nr:hypothetical protein [Halobacteriovorax sp.]